MKMFRFCIEGAEDTNRNGLPEVKVSAQILGYTVLDESVDLSPQDAFKMIVSIAGKFNLFK